MRTRRWMIAGLVLVATVPVAACTQGPAESPEAARWWSHIEYLASDDLEGRNTGTAGYDRAAAYVADQFAAHGALPGADGSYLQPVGFTSRRFVDQGSSLELVRDGRATPIEIGPQAVFSVNLDPAERVEADLVFAGYGMTVPEVGHDDFENVDVRGKVVVYMHGAPEALKGPLRAHMQSTQEHWRMQREAGAIGSIFLPNPKYQDVPWERSSLRRYEARMTLLDPALQRTPGKQLGVSMNPEHAEMLFEGSGHTYSEILQAVNDKRPLPVFPLRCSLRASLAVKMEEVESPNVVGIIEGSDPVLKNEYVVLSGHLDHLGVGGAVEGDSIYNGAIDNASGISTMIEIARMLQEEGTELKRSLVLLAVTGEEKGLLGSQYYAAHPTVDGPIVANINMDMYMPVIPFEHLIVYGIDESDLGDLMPALVESYGVALQPDPTPDRNIFIRSDQYNFVKKGVPALSFKFGAPEGSPEDETLRAWIKNRYHSPQDDLAQPVDKEAAVAFTLMLKELCVEIANAPERPQWKESSFFRRFATGEQVAQATGR